MGVSYERGTPVHPEARTPCCPPEAPLVAEGGGGRGKVASTDRPDGGGEAERGASEQVLFFTLVTGPRRSLRLKLSDTRVYEPQTRARLGTTALSPRFRGVQIPRGANGGCGSYIVSDMGAL